MQPKLGTQSLDCSQFSSSNVPAKLSEPFTIADISLFLKFMVIKRFSSFDLPKAFTDRHFAFYSKELEGTSE